MPNQSLNESPTVSENESAVEERREGLRGGRQEAALTHVRDWWRI